MASDDWLRRPLRGKSSVGKMMHVGLFFHQCQCLSTGVVMGS